MSATFPALPPFLAQPGFGDTPVGAVVAFAGDVAGGQIEASGWMPCDGRMLDAASYPELFVVLGYLYGGADAQFCVPDYRGSLLRGHAADAAAQAAPGISAGPAGPEHSAKSSGVNYLIKFTYGMRTRQPFPASPHSR